jgi:SAM-dependent methyltransferase
MDLRTSGAVDGDELLSAPLAGGRVTEQRLDEIAARYDPSDPTEQFDYWLKRLQAGVVAPWLRGRRVLELGCATGELSSLLAPMAEEYHIVEGSRTNIEAARRRVPEATFVHSFWENFEPVTLFSDVVAFNAIEHAADPEGLLRLMRSWLEPDGRAHIVVPNGLSLHRLVGVELGMLPNPLDLSEGDRAQGHERNYTIDSLRADVAQAGFRIVHWQGIFLKVLSNRQMLDWDWDLIQAIHRVAQRFPEHGAELYAIAQPT